MAVKLFNLADVMDRVDRTQHNKQAREQNALLMQRQQRSFDREDRQIALDESIKDAYRGAIGPNGETDRNRLLSSLAQVAPMKAHELSRQHVQEDRATEKHQASKQKAELANSVERSKYAADVLSRATRDTWHQVIAGLKQGGFKVADIAPAEFDEQWRSAQLQTADTFIKQAETKLNQEFTAGQNDQNRALTMRGQNISANNAAQGRALQRRGQDISAHNAMMASQGVTREPTKGEVEVDKAFAKDVYAPYKASGGFADSQKLIGQLEGASRELGRDDSLTGAFRGRTPDFVREITNPKAIDVRERVEEVVQRNLREVLGAQFTEKEGNRLIARAYNPNLDEKVNKRRVDALIKQMKTASKTKEAAIKYFEKNGTLQGWGGKMPTMGDFEAAVEGGAKGSTGGWSIKKVN